ncbi:MAG: 30S ribosomal protein S3 [Nanoarchaeota archaeon]
MIEKQIVGKNLREYLIQDYVKNYFPKGSYSKIDLKKTPLGEKIIVHTAMPGLVVGRKGENISELTKGLKLKFNMENPQIEIAEINEVNLDPMAVSQRIATSFERFGPKRFKFIGYKELQNILDAGAIGAEIVISGRGVPGARAKSWRFQAGHLKKSGDISENYVKRAIAVANLKSGTIGIKVNILTSDIVMPDEIKIKPRVTINMEQVQPEIKEEKKKIKEKKPRKKKEKAKIKENEENRTETTE